MEDSVVEISSHHVTRGTLLQRQFCHSFKCRYGKRGVGYICYQFSGRIPPSWITQGGAVNVAAQAMLNLKLGDAAIGATTKVTINEEAPR